jgi:hypothetical protein
MLAKSIFFSSHSSTFLFPQVIFKPGLHANFEAKIRMDFRSLTVLKFLESLFHRKNVLLSRWFSDFWSHI